MQAGTTPKKRTSLNGRAALKLMRLDGAQRADQAASDARVTTASSSIAVALLLISSGASATECQSSPGHEGAAYGRAPAALARAAALASQADEAVEVVDAAPDHSSHRDRAGGRRIAVSTSAMDLVQELQKTADELAGAHGRTSRAN